MTFIATATAILHAGAVPVFADVEPDTGLLDVEKVESAITSRTKAILPVHLYGTMVDMKSMRSLADRHCLKIIEDCAHSIESERDGIRPGELGDAACYSFYATKNLTCGEGGALATNNLDLAEKVRCLRMHGMSKDAAGRYSGLYKHWDMIALGWKYNLNDILAALLVDQIDKIDRYREKREALSRLYDSEFHRLQGVEMPSIHGRSARHLYTIWVDPSRRDDILHTLQRKKIGVAVNYRAIHALSYFSNSYGFKPDNFPVADLIGRRTISLPLYPKLTESEVRYVIDTLENIILQNSKCR